MMTAVQDLRGWSWLAEPGTGPKVVALGWEGEVARARAMDRRSLEAHRGAVERLEAWVGKAALQAAVDDLNVR